jgi:hypothetical protein
MNTKLQHYICEDSTGEYHQIDADGLDDARYQFDKLCMDQRKLLAVYECVYEDTTQ